MSLQESLFQIVLIAVSYYLFNNEFFSFTAKIKGVRVSYPVRIMAFFIIFLWFVIASYLELPLVVNWFIFLIILGLEVYIIFKYNLLTSYALSMFCVITGLAVNVLFRSFSSIILEVPLNLFDKTKSSIKTIPIFLAFLVVALFLYVLRQLQFTLNLEKMLQNKESLVFYARTEVYIYVFLMIQLLVFTQSGSTMGIKTWGIKSALFSALILFIAIIYSLRVASLHYYIDKRHEMREHLIQEKKNINKLWRLAYTDMLTGCNNRQLLDKRLEEYAKYGGSITLAFIDINGLKAVNDQFGHVEGDHYLISVSQALMRVARGFNIDLFRYGGDEFVLMSNTLYEKDISQLLFKANELLKANEHIQYNRSVSYGVIHGNSADYPKLLTAADESMYQFKMKYYEEMARS